MADISSYIKSHLLEPLKNYPTIIQDTMIEIITEKLQTLYDYTVQFPEIVSPHQDRLDMLQVIANQFLFTLREDADLQEQIDILDNILYVYRKRGSVDTIENMWNYYGGSLPKDVEVYIPSYDLFRYSISKLSGTHGFSKGNTHYVILDNPLEEPIESGALIRKIGDTRIRVTPGAYEGDSRVFLSTADGFSIGDSLEIVGRGFIGNIIDIHNDLRETTNRPGVYEIRLYNNTYPISDLKEFLIEELVAAGNSLYFSHMLHMQVSGGEIETNPYKYLVREDNQVSIQLEALRSQRGIRWSSYTNLSGNFILPDNLLETYNDYLNDNLGEDERLKFIQEMKKLPTNNFGSSIWSGKESILLEIATSIELSNMNVQILLDTYKPILERKVYLDNLASYEDDDKYYSIYKDIISNIESKLYCTPTDPPTPVQYNLFAEDENGKEYEVVYEYPGIFILGDTLLDDYVKGIPLYYQD